VTFAEGRLPNRNIELGNITNPIENLREEKESGANKMLK